MILLDQLAQNQVVWKVMIWKQEHGGGILNFFLVIYKSTLKYDGNPPSFQRKFKFTGMDMRILHRQFLSKTNMKSEIV